MGKYDLKFKQAVAMSIIDGKYSTMEASRKYNVPQTTVYRWFRKYEISGAKSCIKQKTKKYTGDFKVSVIEYMHKNHLSTQETAFKFLMPSDTPVRRWERIYYEEGREALFKDNRGRKKTIDKNNPLKYKLTKKVEEDLISENQRLRMENAYLKKLNALVQKRIQQKNGKK